MKNRVFRVEKIVHGGMGIVRDGRHTIFVPFVIPDEEVKIRVEPGSKSPTRAAVTEIVSASPDRVEPPCPLFGACGGCQFQHVEYRTQLSIKRDILAETLARIARINKDIDPVLPSVKQYNYRSRIKLHIQGGMPGFFAEKKSDFLEVEQCRIAHESINEILPSLRLLMQKEIADTVELAVEEDGSLTAVLEEGSRKKVYRRKSPGDWAPATDWKVAFRQVNPLQNEVLRKITADTVADIAPREVMELYAGSGNLTEVIAPFCSTIVAVDADAEAIALGREKPGGKITFEHAKSEDFVASAIERGLKPDMIVLDPPRTGAKEAIGGIVRLAPCHIIYVSCDPATLARDLSELLFAGYEIKSLTPIDMFPQTAHIEAVTVLAMP